MSGLAGNADDGFVTAEPSAACARKFHLQELPAIAGEFREHDGALCRPPPVNVAELTHGKRFGRSIAATAALPEIAS
jgi:hypothetical protein